MTGIPLSCAHCGRPIGGSAVWLGSFVYHDECTRGPGSYQAYAPLPRYYGGLTEQRVREIVREELAGAHQEGKPA